MLEKIFSFFSKKKPNKKLKSVSDKLKNILGVKKLSISLKRPFLSENYIVVECTTLSQKINYDLISRISKLFQTNKIDINSIKLEDCGCETCDFNHTFINILKIKESKIQKELFD